MHAQRDAVRRGHHARAAQRPRDVARLRHADPGRIERRGQRAVDRRAVDHPAAPRLERSRETRVHRVERALRRPARGRDCRDPARRLDHLHDAANPLGGGAVDADQPAVADGALPDRGMHHVRQPHVAREIGRSVDLGGCIDPRHRRPDQPARALHPEGERFGQSLARGLLGECGEPEPFRARDDEARLGPALRPVRVPAPRGRLAQQHARRRACGPARLLEHPDRARPAGQHRRRARDRIGDRAQHPLEQRVQPDRIGIERVQRRGLDADRPPVRAKLVGDDLREGGIGALAMLGLRYRDRDMPVAADLQPRPERGLAGIGDERRRIVARPQPPGDDQPDPRTAPRHDPPPTDHPAPLPRLPPGVKPPQRPPRRRRPTGGNLPDPGS